MDSIGDRLKEAREEKGLSLEQVMRDTHISKTFIAAIEREDFSIFPGETYIVGFIRNYAEYLGFKGDDFVQMYRNLMIQGQPLPLDELVTTPSFFSKKRVLILSGVISGILCVTFVVLFSSGLLELPSKKSGKALISASKRQGKSMEFNASREIFEMSLKDRVNLTDSTHGKDYSIVVESVDEVLSKARLKILRSDGHYLPSIEITAGSNQAVDFDQDGVKDVRISLNAVKRDGVISIELNRAFVEGPNFLLKDPLFTEEFLLQDRFSRPEAIVLSGKVPSAFEVTLSGKESSLIKYRIDGGDLLDSLGFPPQEEGKKNLSFKVKSGIIFWLANRYGTTLFVNAKEVALPNQGGPSAAFFLSWKPNANNGYDLVLFTLDSEKTSE